MKEHHQPCLSLLFSNVCLLIYRTSPPFYLDSGVKEGRKFIKLECSHRFAMGDLMFLFAENKGPVRKQYL